MGGEADANAPDSEGAVSHSLMAIVAPVDVLLCAYAALDYRLVAIVM